MVLQPLQCIFQIMLEEAQVLGPDLPEGEGQADYSAQEGGCADARETDEDVLDALPIGHFSPRLFLPPG
jgi:hypothetical protein